MSASEDIISLKVYVSISSREPDWNQTVSRQPNQTGTETLRPNIFSSSDGDGDSNIEGNYCDGDSPEAHIIISVVIPTLPMHTPFIFFLPILKSNRAFLSLLKQIKTIKHHQKS